MYSIATIHRLIVVVCILLILSAVFQVWYIHSEHSSFDVLSHELHSSTFESAQAIVEKANSLFAPSRNSNSYLRNLHNDIPAKDTEVIHAAIAPELQSVPCPIVNPTVNTNHVSVSSNPFTLKSVHVPETIVSSTNIVIVNRTFMTGMVHELPYVFPNLPYIVKAWR